MGSVGTSRLVETVRREALMVPSAIIGELIPPTRKMFSPSYLTACLRALPAVNRATRRFGILIGAPVCGLRAVRALRLAVLNVPKPTN